MVICCILLQYMRYISYILWLFKRVLCHYVMLLCYLWSPEEIGGDLQ